MRDIMPETADTQEKYEGLRDLWHRVFGDGYDFIDHVYRSFGADPDAGRTGSADAGPDSPDITGYVMTDKDGKVISALTCYRAGTLHVPGGDNEGDGGAGVEADELHGRPVYVSYAVCTDPEYRGQGLAGKLTGYVRDKVVSEGGISLVSPAEEGLIIFYEALGYRQSCYADEAESDRRGDWEPEVIDEEYEDTAAFIPGSTAEPADAASYDLYREAFLREIPHVHLSARMLEFIRSESMGGEGLLIINGGDAVCAASAIRESGKNPGRRMLFADEFLVNPQLTAFSEEIGEEIAGRLAESMDADGIVYRKPGTGRCISMSSGAEALKEFYFGFPVE